MMKIGRNYGRPRQYIIWVTKFIQGSTASDSGGTVNAQGLRPSATKPLMESYERNWDASSGSMWNMSI